MSTRLDRWSAVLGLILLPAAGCIGNEPLGLSAPDSSAPRPSASDPSAPGPSASDPSIDCRAAPTATVSYATPSELDALLVGRWQRCLAPQALGEDVGVEFVASGHWYPLTHDGAGAVVRGADAGGIWSYLPPGAPNAISGVPDPRGQLVLDGAYTDPPQFTVGPRQMHILFSPVPSMYVPLR